MRTIRTAVVGLNMGLAHANAYALSEKSDLRYVVDLDEHKAKSVAAELVCEPETDWRKVLPEVDAISFATPHHLHAPMALEAIRMGKHVLIEKPLALSEAECAELIREAEAHGVVLMVAYIVRYRPEVQLLKQIVDSGQYGRPLNANCWVESYLRPAPESWFAKRATLGGGVLFSHGCHYIDLLTWLLGKPVQVAGLGTRLGTEWMEGEGTHHSILKFESGALAHQITSWGLKVNCKPALLHVHTPEACLVLYGSKLEAVTAEGRQLLYEPPGDRNPKAGALHQIEHFLDCIATGGKPLTDGMAGLESQRVIWSIYNQERAAASVH